MQLVNLEMRILNYLDTITESVRRMARLSFPSSSTVEFETFSKQSSGEFTQKTEFAQKHEIYNNLLHRKSKVVCLGFQSNNELLHIYTQYR